MTDLIKLAERVEAGEAEPMEVDAALMTGLSLAATATIIKALNGSLDAAKALHDAVLPEWGWAITTTIGVDDWFTVAVGKPKHKGSETSAISPSAAWVAAILRAKAADEAAQIETIREEEEREKENDNGQFGVGA